MNKHYPDGHNLGMGMIPHKMGCKCDECRLERLERENAELVALLTEWERWVDLGIEDVIKAEWVKPVLRKTYDKTKEFLDERR